MAAVMSAAKIIYLPSARPTDPDLELASESLNNAKAFADELTKAQLWMDVRLHEAKESVARKGR
jgi:hypothetical protein